MSRDLWLSKREVIEIGKIKKSLTLSADSFSSFRRLACLEYNVSDNNDNKFTSPSIIQTAFTIEFWFKPLSSVASKQTLYKYGETVSQIEISINSGTLTASAFKAAVATDLTGPYISYEWNHVAFTYDNATLILYINGVQITSTALAGPVDTGSLFSHLSQADVLTEQFIGRMGELRIWTVARTYDQIIQTYRWPSNAGLGDVTGLVHYYKCNGVSISGAGEEQDQIDTSKTLNASSTKFTTEDAPPLIYGASFAVVEYPISVDSKFSFQFPVTIPEDCTGMLIVRWIDDNNEVQRRRFWDLDGVDINPMPVVYAGEVVAEDFVLELWNVDGAETVELPDDLILRISKTSHPETSHDTTAVAAATITPDETLGESFPWTFPLTFNSIQTYI